MDVQNSRKIDLSTLMRDELRDLLSTAKNEWEKYTNYKDEIKLYEKQIVEEKKKEEFEKRQKQPAGVVLIITGIIMVIFIIAFPIILVDDTKKTEGLPLALGICGAISLFFIFLGLGCFNAAKRRKIAAQNIIKECETQLPELQKKEVEAASAFDKVWNIPDEYCYKYAFTKMLQYIDSFKAHNWKEVTTLYDRHIHEQTVENNTRITAEEAIKQTEISKQIRNAARTAAAGALIAAMRR